MDGPAKADKRDRERNMMKSLKAAAVLAGFVAIAGAAAPAHAEGPMPTSVDGGLNTLLSQPTLDVTPVSTSMLDIGDNSGRQPAS
ncbi:hypothetical protein ACF09C_27310 [Streptomyces sp. NPDC014870]|uniref:hypothetical protein n=1 Tax=Streptomyces sp. NPDC014870 TaxID=3364925 RepID=UPI0037019597